MVLLADNHAIVTEGVRLYLGSDFEVVATVSDGRALVEAAGRLRPDAVVLDVFLPVLNGIAAVQRIKKEEPNIKFIYLTACSEVACVREALAAGGCAYVLKTAPPSELVKAIRIALDGGVFIAQPFQRHIADFPQPEFTAALDLPRLTPRETEVLRLIAGGRRTKEVARLLGLSPRTVEFHKYRITDRLGIKSTAELTQYAMRHGVVIGG